MTGQRPIEAIFENGVFKPLAEVRLPEHQRVSLVVSMEDDLTAELLSRAAEAGGGFDFLAEAHEDIYSPEDGEAV